MKVSDLMLDMATGDASELDAHIKFAAGKINVSHAIFEASYKISELPAGEEFLIVQEAADAGLPTDAEGASALANQSVNEELKAFFDLTVATARKVKQSTEKAMKLILAIGKKYGVAAPTGGDFAKEFAEPLGKAIVSDKGKKLTLGDKRFLKGLYSDQIAECYGLGMINFLSAYGLTFGNSALNGTFAPYKSKREVTSFKDLYKNLAYGGKLIDFDKTVNKEKHYTNAVKASDITDLACAVFEVLQISKAVVDVAGNAAAKKNALNLVNELSTSDTASEKKVSRVKESINSGITGWTASLTAITDNITKAFTDSVYALTESVNG